MLQADDPFRYKASISTLDYYDNPIVLEIHYGS